MRPILFLLLLAAVPALAQSAPRPKRLGEFQAWTAASLGDALCYAFARPTRTEGTPGRRADAVMLVVTHRREGRDQVALQAGYAYPRNTDGDDDVQIAVGARALPFYTAQDSAFARDGRAAVAAFKAGREAVAKGPAAAGRGEVRDIFPLAGFNAAYDAISRECPVKR